MLAAVAGCLLSGPARAGVESLPPGHWAYEELEHFESRGLVRLHGSRPYSRVEVRRWVDAVSARADSGAALTDAERRRLARLRDEFVRGDSLPDAGQRFDPPLVRMAQGDWAFFGDTELGTGGHSGSKGDGADTWGRSRLETAIEFRDWLVYETRYSVALEPETGARSGQNYLSSRQRNWHGLTSDNDRAYVAAERGALRLSLGRDFIGWGPDRGGELLVADAGQSFDALQVRLRLRRFQLTSVAALLSNSRNRRFAAHRLEVDLGPLQLGAQEAVVYQSPNLEPAYLFPISFYFGNQYSERVDDNSLLGLDLKWRSPWAVLQGELLVDDLIYDGDAAPQKLGWRCGLMRALALPGGDVDLRFGYTRLDRWVYSHRHAINDYVAGGGDAAAGEPFLGSALGPDADRLQAEAGWMPGARWSVWLRYARTRRGDGNRDLTPWNPGAPYRLPFPSGVVQRESSTELEAHAWLSRYVELRAGAGWRISPSGHEPRLLGELRLDL